MLAGTELADRLFIPLNDPEVTYSMPQRQLIAVADRCCRSPFPAAVPERCRCRLNPGTGMETETAKANPTFSRMSRKLKVVLHPPEAA